MLKNILNDLKTNNYIINIIDNQAIDIKEGNANFKITKIQNIDDICSDEDFFEYLEYFNNTKNYYSLIVNIFIKEENITKNFYDIFEFSSPDNILKRLDIFSEYNYSKLNNIINCDDYTIESLINNSCISCKEGYNFSNNINNEFKTCYKIPDCNAINKKFIPEKNICINNCSMDDKYKYEFNNICYKEPIIGSSFIDDSINIKIDNGSDSYEINVDNNNTNCSIKDFVNKLCNINYKENLSNQIIQEILSGNLNDIIEEALNNKSGVIFSEESALYQITSLKNLIFNTDLPSINFSQCEQLLINEYKINDEEIMIYMIQNKVEGLKIPIIDYLLFTQHGKMKMNLSVCNNITVEYNIPVEIEEKDIDKYDPSSDYYNDECNIDDSSEENYDLTLYDRKNEYNDKNRSLCESSCTYKGYNITSSKAICECNIKNEINYSSNNTNDLLNKIQSDKSSSNLGVTKCTNVFTSPEKIKTNSGFITIIIILGIFIIVFILFCIKEKDRLEIRINDDIYKKFEKNKIDNEKKIEKHNIIKSNSYLNKKNKKGLKIKTSKQKLNKNLSSKSKSNFVEHGKKPEIINFDTGQGLTNIKPDYENDYEMNWLSYEDALEYDKRSCCDYYCSLIKNKQLITFTFCTFNDYNSGIIKKFTIFLSFALHFTINALFFNDSNMHQIYEDQGKYNFSYQISYIIISAICSTIILRIMLETLILTDKSALLVKNQPTKNLAIRKKIEVLKYMNIKLAIFFILNFLLLILFGYYLTCLTGRYENTQIQIIENTVISFGFSLFYPFIINIFPTVLRIYSLDKKQKDKKCIYIISNYLQYL